MNNRLWITLGTVCGCLIGLVISILSAGTATLAQNPAGTPTPDHYLYLPLAARNYCIQHRHGDWVVTGSETVESCTVFLDGNLFVRLGGSLTLTKVTMFVEQKPSGMYQILAEAGSSLVISTTTLMPAQIDQHFAFLVEGAHFELRRSHLEGLSDLAGQPYRGGLQLKDVAGAILDGNTIIHDEWFGVWLTDCTEATITDNTFDNIGPGGQSGAIYLERSHRNTITHNHLWHEWDALHLRSSWDNYIAHNELTLTDHTIGISLWYASGNNVVAQNHIAADEGAFA